MAIKQSSFKSNQGANEFYISVESKDGLSLNDGMSQIYNAMLEKTSSLNLGKEDIVFSRIFLSDISNQANEVYKTDLFLFLKNGATSLVEQRPVLGGKISLLSYFIQDKNRSLEKKFFEISVGGRECIAVQCKGRSYDLFWNADFSVNKPFNSSLQTNSIFESYNHFLEENEMSLLQNTVRTWLFVRDVDNHYAGMVEARKKYFEKQGLTQNTRFIASTGIEAKMESTSTLVSFDAFAIRGLKADQMQQLKALENLNPTHEYGVTFERGTKIIFGDRSHFYISGTASIDKYGNVLHINDPGKQCHRTLDNIEALLSPHNASLEMMQYFIVYLRNPNDQKEVTKVLNERISSKTPLIFVHGPVCRPEWLVEIEGVAVMPCKSNYPAFF